MVFNINDVFKLNERRIQVWNETHELNLKKFVNVPKSIKFKYQQRTKNISKTKTEVFVVKMDTIDCVLKHQNALLLNMADDFNPGGVVTQGSGAQEENIFRRSNIELTLDYKVLYPIQPDEVIYSPDVTIYRENEKKDYRFMENPRKLCIVSCPAIRHPVLENGKLKEKERSMMIKKIDTIFDIAKHFKHEVVVLSAHGCGAWKNPPECIAELYKERIKFYNFKKIYFAIIENPLMKDKNYNIFKKVFEI